MKIIRLVVKGVTFRLSNEALGKKLFTEQVKDNLDTEDKVVVAFPMHISVVSSKFVKGFTEELGKEEFNKRIYVTGNQKFVNRFYYLMNK